LISSRFADIKNYMINVLISFLFFSCKLIVSRMIQIKHNISETLFRNSVECKTEYNLKNNLIRNHGWFAKSKSICKYLIQRVDGNQCEKSEVKPTARCFECYELVGFEDIGYSRIINNYNRGCAGNGNGSNGSNSGIENVKILEKELSGFEKYYKLSVICSRCVSSKTEFKNAPKTYSDIISDFLIQDKLDILAADLGIIGCQKLDQLNDSIVKLLFNYNEKQIMLNHIVKENDNLRRNLEMEIEKHKILSEYKSKNRELHDSLKNHLLQSSIDLYKTQKKVIDEQLAIYSEYNNSSRYNVPECRICMQQEVCMALECGHLSCLHCHKKMHAENMKKLVEDNDENVDENDKEEPIQVDGYPCPFCKTYSSKFIRIYI